MSSRRLSCSALPMALPSSLKRSMTLSAARERAALSQAYLCFAASASSSSLSIHPTHSANSTKSGGQDCREEPAIEIFRQSSDFFQASLRI